MARIKRVRFVVIFNFVPRTLLSLYVVDSLVVVVVVDIDSLKIIPQTPKHFNIHQKLY